jgi:hypothetical protein
MTNGSLHALLFLAVALAAGTVSPVAGAAPQAMAEQRACLDAAGGGSACPDGTSARRPWRIASAENLGAWRLVRTANPQGGPDAVSVMRTADTAQSDIEFVGLMLRCSGPGFEVVLVSLTPFPLKARPKVTIAWNGKSEHVEANIGFPGLAVVLPASVLALASGPWQSAGRLSAEISDSDRTIRGVIGLDGIEAALKTLRMNCPSP